MEQTNVYCYSHWYVFDYSSSIIYHFQVTKEIEAEIQKRYGEYYEDTDVLEFFGFNYFNCHWLGSDEELHITDIPQKL